MAASVVATLAFIGALASAKAQISPIPDAPDANEITEIVKETFAYGVPLVMNYAVMYGAAIDPSSDQHQAPFNHIGNARRVFTHRDTLIVTPNSDTPYSSIWLDLRAEPIVISVPQIESRRYYSCMLCDANTYNFGYIGTRTTGNEAGTFLVAGPDWRGRVPAGIKKFYRSHAQFAFALFRTQLFDPDDMPNVIAIQNGYRVRPLSAYLNQAPPPAPPAIDFPRIDKVTATNPKKFFEYLDFILPYLPTTHPKELEMRRKLQRIGVGPGKRFNFSQLAATQMRAIARGFVLGEEKLNSSTKEEGEVRNGWHISHGGGDLGYYDGNWVKRAIIARQGIYALDYEEAIYPVTRVDGTGQRLNGRSNSYTLTFSNGSFPPAKSFWSVTMYDSDTQLLVENPINRYLINSPMLPSLVKNPDGGVTIYIQRQSPSEDKVPNWLPAPNGPIYLAMRLYLPKFPDVSSWSPPPVVRSTTSSSSKRMVISGWVTVAFLLFSVMLNHRF